MNKVYIDGTLYDESEAKVSVFDHGLLYGDGIFEGIRIYNGRVFRLKEHIVRLFRSARAILLDIGMTEEAVSQAVLETSRANELREGYIRLVVTRGPGGLGLNPFLCPKASVIVIASKIQLYPEEKYTTGLKVVTCATRRINPGAFNPAIKSLNYLNNVLAKIEAIQAGGDEGLMLNEQGLVAECTGDNVFSIRDGVLYSPPVYAGSLDGITREVILEIAKEQGIPFLERNLTRYDLFTADEAFLTGTAAEVIPMVELDRRVIGDGTAGPLTRMFIEEFRKIAYSTGEPI